MAFEISDREWVKRAVDNDKPALIEGIKVLYNCRDADADTDGDVWIADPQRGHWLDEDGIARVARALKAGDI